MEHRLITAIQSREAAGAFPGAGGDQISIRVDGEHGVCPLAVVEGVTEDREWLPRHSHPWDELTYVLEGTIAFKVGDQQGEGPAGTIVTLPRGVPHTLRVPEGTARYLLITLGAPSLAFLQEVGQAYAQGPTLERLVEIAARHGVKPDF